MGDLRLAVHLTRSLAQATKYRTACDLLMWLDPPQPVDWSEVHCERVCEVALGEQIRQAYEQATLERFGATSQWQPELRDRVSLLLPKLNDMRHKVVQSERFSRAGKAGVLPLFSQSSDENV